MPQLDNALETKTSSDAATLPVVSIIIPTYNESRNILDLIRSIKSGIDDHFSTEVIIVDDNSPDKTARIVEEFAYSINKQKDYHQQYGSKKVDVQQIFSVRVICRESKNGLVSAVLEGVKNSLGNYILILDADFSHPPNLIARMIQELSDSDDLDMVIASRYAREGKIQGWSYRRRLISFGATKIARYGLGIKNTSDPMSGFFAFKRRVINNIYFDAIGYKILIEILVKSKITDIKILDIPYTFQDRRDGKSKLDSKTILQYPKACGRLLQYKVRNKSSVSSIKQFFQKVGKFFLVGASGVVINYTISSMLTNGALSNLWYLYASMIGILCSVTSNFLLNKSWTFEDKDFSWRHTLKQYGLFLSISSGGIILQLLLVISFVTLGLQYERSLFLAIMTASIGNFLLNSKFTFKSQLARTIIPK